jgi:riboflavin kinase / FMN adenylyltransferase
MYQSLVTEGRGRGKTLGFPTLNLDIPVKFDYGYGVYAGWVTIDGQRRRGAFHYGPIPVFNIELPKLEVHVVDANLDKITGSISFEFTQFLRAIKNFPSVDDLIKAIAADVDKTRTVLKE